MDRQLVTGHKELSVRRQSDRVRNNGGKSTQMAGTTSPTKEHALCIYDSLFSLSLNEREIDSLHAASSSLLSSFSHIVLFLFHSAAAVDHDHSLLLEREVNEYEVH